MPLQFNDFPPSGSAFFQDQLPKIIGESNFMIENGGVWEPTEENLSCVLWIYDAFGVSWPGDVGLLDVSAKLEAPYSSSDGRATFRIAEVFDFEIEKKIPEFYSTFRSNQRISKEVGIRIFDKAGSPPELQPDEHYSPNTFKLIHGSFPRHMGTPSFASRNFFVAHNYARSASTTPEHTWPRKRVHCKQPEWVYIYNNSSLRTADLSLRVYYLNGGSEIIDLDNADLYPKSHTVLQLGYNYMIENLVASLPSDEVVRYDIIIGIDGLSTVIPYEMVGKPHLWNAYILHYNGMSGYETIWLSGKQQPIYTSNQVEFSRFENPDGPFDENSQAVNYDFIQKNRFTRESIDLNTGWMDAYAFPHIQQLLHGPCYLCDIDRNIFRKVSFQNAEVTGPRDDEATHRNVQLRMVFDQKDRYWNNPDQNYPQPL